MDTSSLLIKVVFIAICPKYVKYNWQKTLTDPGLNGEVDVVESTGGLGETGLQKQCYSKTSSQLIN